VLHLRAELCQSRMHLANALSGGQVCKEQQSISARMSCPSASTPSSSALAPRFFTFSVVSASSSGLSRGGADQRWECHLVPIVRQLCFCRADRLWAQERKSRWSGPRPSLLASRSASCDKDCFLETDSTKKHRLSTVSLVARLISHSVPPAADVFGSRGAAAKTRRKARGPLYTHQPNSITTPTLPPTLRR
jgi:hypothetical protein